MESNWASLSCQVRKSGHSHHLPIFSFQLYSLVVKKWKITSCHCNAGLEMTSKKLLNQHYLPGPNACVRFHCHLLQEIWPWPGCCTREGKEAGKSDGNVPIDAKWSRWKPVFSEAGVRDLKCNPWPLWLGRGDYLEPWFWFSLPERSFSSAVTCFST